jgi:phage-related protein
MMSEDGRTIVWNKQARKAFVLFPEEVRDSFSMALEEARLEQYPEIADPYGQPLGSGYYKLKDDDEQSNTYRVVYYTKHKEAIYIMHGFPKKSKSGKADPPEEVVTAQARVKWVELEHELWKLSQAEKAKKAGGGGSQGQPSKKKGGK